MANPGPLAEPKKRSPATAGESARFWDERARAAGHTGWANEVLYRYDQPLRVGWILRYLRRLYPDLSGVQVLDVGCGTGDLVVKLAQGGALVTGVDISPTVIAMAREQSAHLKSVTLEVADVADFGGDGRGFDLITSITVLQHLTDTHHLQRSLHQLHALLRPGGHLMLLELAPERPGQVVLTGSHVLVRTRGEWVQALEETGFQSVAAYSFPQLGVAMLHNLGRLLARGHAEQVGAEQLGSEAVSDGWKAVARRLILLFAYPFDRLLGLPTPEWAALYRILLFRRPAAAGENGV